jgi:choline-sulfatase
MYDPAKMDPPIDDPLEGAPTLLHKKQKAQTGAMPPDAWRACRANYYGMINVVDDAIAAMLDSLEKRGAIENTIVIYTSDHGEMLFNHGFHGKSLMYEESAGVPLIVRWPKHFQKGAASEALTSALDLVPALLSVAGAPAMKAIHGVSVLPVLTGRSSAHREEVFSEMGTMKMLRRGDWKYVYDPAWNVQQLLNLREDPREMKNLSGAPDQAARERDMRDRILQWMIETESRPNTTGGTARE